MRTGPKKKNSRWGAAALPGAPDAQVKRRQTELEAGAWYAAVIPDVGGRGKVHVLGDAADQGVDGHVVRLEADVALGAAQPVVDRGEDQFRDLPAGVGARDVVARRRDHHIPTGEDQVCGRRADRSRDAEADEAGD